MTEQNIATIVERSLGQQAPYLRESIVRTIHERLNAGRAPRAIVMNLNSMRSMARGTYRRFTATGAVEVYA